MVTKLAEDVSRRVKAEVHRPDFGLRIIIIWKATKATLLIAVAIVAFVFHDHDLHELGVGLVEWLGIDPASPRVESVLAKLDSQDSSIQFCLLAAKAEVGLSRYPDGPFRVHERSRRRQGWP